MTNAQLTHSRALSAAAARRPARRRFIVVRQRRGVVLIFVVVLLTLLAIMGTAYLATSRLDRQALTGRGALPGTLLPQLRDTGTLDRVSRGAERAVQNALIKDLFNHVQPTGGLATRPDDEQPDDMPSAIAFSTFRQRIVNSTYENYDAPGRADPWLSSLLPRPRTVGQRDFFVWPWISRPLHAPAESTAGVPNLYIEGFFTDPRFMTTSGTSIFPVRFAEIAANEVLSGTRYTEPTGALTERQNATIRWVAMPRSGNPTPQPAYDNTRMYPGLLPGGIDPTIASNLPYIAGDADGDGIADSGLSPVVLNPSIVNPNVIDRYLDRANNVVYFVSYRVVDNSAKLNLNTALSKRGDIVDQSIFTSGTENADRSKLTRNPPGTGTDAFELRNFLADDLSPTGAMSSATMVPPSAIPVVTPVTAQPAQPGTFGPNYGFFRANVGLTELIRELLIPLPQIQNSNDLNRYPAESELRRLVDVRFPLLRQNPGTGYLQTAETTTAVQQFDIERLAQTFTLPAVAEFRLGNATTVVPGLERRYEYRSFGDLLEQQVARRPESPGGYLWSNTTAVPTLTGLPGIGIGDTLSLAAKNGTLVNPLISSGTAESALMFTTLLSTPNVNNNGRQPWGYFPPNAIDLWFGWTQDWDVVDPTVVSPGALPEITALDATAAIDRAFYYWGTGDAQPRPTSIASPAKPAGTSPVALTRSPRALFTSYSGVTSSTPIRGDLGGVPFFGVPLGMPAYDAASVRYSNIGPGMAAAAAAAGIDFDPGPTFWYPPTKVSAASGTKEQLWRAFWSAMTEQDAVTGRWEPAKRAVTGLNVNYEPNQIFTAFRSSDRWASNESTRAPGWNVPAGDTPKAVAADVLSTRQMALLRSAVAACNAIDMRDSDNDVTAMDVDITDDNSLLPPVPTPSTPSAATPRYYARVYGTEKQLVITGLYMRRGASGDYVAVEIYNPSDEPINLSAYRLNVVTRTTTGTPETKANSTINLQNAAPAGIIALDAAAGPNATLLPGGYLLVHTDATVTPPAADSISWPAETTAPAAGTAQVRILTGATAGANVGALLPLINGVPRNTELMLTRTRRADGVAFTDDSNKTGGTTPLKVRRQAIEDEVVTDPRTLVPVDAVDCRFNAQVSSGAGPDYKYLYKRATPLPPGLTTGVTNATPLFNATPPAGGINDERKDAWRCFYAGKFYEMRPTPSTLARTPTLPDSAAGAAPLWTLQNPGPDGGYAWRDISGTAVPAYAFASAHTDLNAPRGDPDVLRAPPIPIQTFTPFDPYTETKAAVVANQRGRVISAATPTNALEVYGLQSNTGYTGAIAADPALRGVFHLINKFPYGSPFARDGDLMSIPYIGSYKVYRATGTTAADIELYEYVPLPMDATSIAPTPDAVAPYVTPPAPVKTVGRFDPRFNYTNAQIRDGLANDWASNLTDFVTARNAPYNTMLPDVPDNSREATYIRVPGTGLPPAPAENLQDQRYAQDGPVVSATGVVNPYADVRWVSFTERDTTKTLSDVKIPVDADTTKTPTERRNLRRGADTGTGSATSLIQGVINLNTAPQIVLRQLPWLVNADTGQVDFQPDDYVAGTYSLGEMSRSLVNALDVNRTTRQSAVVTTAADTPNGIATLTQLKDLFVTPQVAFSQPIVTENAMAPVVPLTATPPQADKLLLTGMLNPVGRPEFEADYRYERMNLDRVSNLTSTRSDVYTVYVTVQAWTWVGGIAGANQRNDTRLVGERRTSFVVDRSKISQLNHSVGNLIVLPIEKE